MIHIGTSGFSYKDWKGYFYPENIKEADMLAFYKQHFDTVELNFSYYRIPEPGILQRMVSITGGKMIFSIKAYREITHGEDVPSEEIFTRFIDALEPLITSNTLGCVLLQFPWNFFHSRISKERLKLFKERLGNLPLVAEFRNRQWVNEDAFGLLRTLGIGFCCVDEPNLKDLMPPVAVATSDIGYIRLHGRNAQKWWNHRQPHERYDYLYTKEELLEWVPKIRALKKNTKELFIYANNHFQGKAPKNAKMLIDLLSDE